MGSLFALATISLGLLGPIAIFLGNLFRLLGLLVAMRKFSPLLGATFLMLAHCSPSEEVAAANASTETIYLALTADPAQWNRAEAALAARWDISQVPFALEAQSLSRSPVFARTIYRFLDEQTGKNFGLDRHQWQSWLWSQDYDPDPNYPSFKSKLYRQIDPKFGKYFDNDRKSTIRLDQAVWGGVLQDGIPPLRGPKMISAASANYLADSDIVFGIEVDGDARAYPKRILAWHEMFVDTIQGIPLAGVY